MKKSTRTATIALALGLSVATALFAGHAKAQITFRDCPQCPEMIAVPTGNFNMGTTVEERARENLADAVAMREAPAHRVIISQQFAIGVTEVTRDQFAAFVSDTGWTAGDSCFSRTATGARAIIEGAYWRTPGIPQAGTHPVVCVAYGDTVAYINWLSRQAGRTYRLPSEAEWEYAARAGTATSWFWGNNRDQACNYAHVPNKQSSPTDTKPNTAFACDDGFAETAPVASFRPNDFGLYDMLGNVWEWTEDCWHPTYDGAPADSQAWTANADCNVRIVRGGRLGRISNDPKVGCAQL